MKFKNRNLLFLLIFFHFSSYLRGQYCGNSIMPNSKNPISIDFTGNKNKPYSKKLEVELIYDDTTSFKAIYLKSKISNGKLSFDVPPFLLGKSFMFGIVLSEVMYYQYSPLVSIHKKVIDNNHGYGYIVNAEDIMGACYKTSNYLSLKNYAIQFLKLKPLGYRDSLEAYNFIFKNSGVNDDKIYAEFLILNYKHEPSKYNQVILEYLLAKRKDLKTESQYANFRKLLKIIGNSDELDIITEEELGHFPKGNLARDMYVQTHFGTLNSIELTNSKAKELETAYISKFGDSLDNRLQPLYEKLYSISLKLNLDSQLITYGNKVFNKPYLIYLNNFVINKSLKELNTTNPDLMRLEFLNQLSFTYLNDKNYLVFAPNILDYKANEYRVIKVQSELLLRKLEYDSSFRLLCQLEGDHALLPGEFINLVSAGLNANKIDTLINISLEKFGKGELTIDLQQAVVDLLRTKSIDVSKFEKLITLAKSQVLLKLQSDVKIAFGVTRLKNFSFLKFSDSTTLNLSTLKGKIVVLDLWASWCEPCLKKFPDWNNLIKENLNDTSLVFLMVATWETKTFNQLHSFVQKFISEIGFEFSSTIVFDTQNILKKTLNIKSLPQYLIITEGNILATGDDIKNINPQLKILKNRLVN